MPDSDDRVGFGSGTSKRGWGGSRRPFSVTRQDRSRLTRYSDVDETYEYPGINDTEGEDD